MYELKITLNETSIEDVEADLLHIAKQIKQEQIELNNASMLKGYGWQIVEYDETE